MATLRLMNLKYSFFRLCRRNPNSPHSFTSSSLLHSSSYPLRLRPFPISFLRPLAINPIPKLDFSTSSSALAVDGPTPSTEEAAVSHSWPEWDLFVDKLKSKGYFDKSYSTSAAETAEGDGGGAARSAASIDLNRVKNACLSFARDRFDILRSLPKEDIQIVVECGCPNLFRKPVNSAKRLRAFLRLDEGDVCSACNLRGSCDKAYTIPNEDEGARTVDVMRILLTYAVDIVAQPGEGKPSVKEHVEESARKLLSEFIKLSDTTMDPALPKPAVRSPSKNEPSQKVVGRDKQSQNVEMKRGDWLCSKCNFMNFSRNVRCLQCKEDGPKSVNFDDAEMKKGDWTCPQCRFMNFARNKTCIRCQESRPKRELNPGEWECPSCDFLNYRRNMVCLKCKCNRPGDEGSRSEDHVWRKPKMATEKRNINFGDDDDEFLDDDDILPIREGKNKFMESKRATPAGRRSTSARKREDSGDDDDEFLDDDDIQPIREGKNKFMESKRATPAGRRSTSARKREDSGDDDDEFLDDDDILPIREGKNKFMESKRATPAGRRSTSARKRDDTGDDDNEFLDDDILPIREGKNKFMESKRATPAGRRLTSARKRDYPS